MAEALGMIEARGFAAMVEAAGCTMATMTITRRKVGTVWNTSVRQF